MSKLSSPIWSYFTINEVDESKANCKICHGKLSRGGQTARSYGTSALINHLHSTHPSAYDEYSKVSTENQAKKRKIDEETSDSAKKGRPTLDVFLDKLKPFGQDSPRQHAITRAIAKMIATDLQPFSIASDTGFVALLKELEPRYVMPSPRHFSRTIMPDLYMSVKDNVGKRVVCITSDVWTSSNNLNSFLGVTGHWIDEEWNRQSAFLQLRALEGRHTGEMLGEQLLSILDAWQIEGTRRGVLVRDNGANMVKAACVANLVDLGCYIHTLQLVVVEGLKAQRVVIDTIATARSIVGHFRHSAKATEQLKKAQELLNSGSNPHLPVHKLIQDISTRWDSTFYMLERLIEQKRAIAVYSQENEISTLTANQWNIADKVVKTLRPFQQQTKEASLSSATSAMIIPGYRLLRRFLEQSGDDAGIQTMRREMVTDLDRRFGRFVADKVCAVATLLDPTCKLQFFVNDEVNEVKRMLLTEALHDLEQRRQTRSSRTQPNVTSAATVADNTDAAASNVLDYQPVSSDSSQAPLILDTIWQSFVQSDSTSASDPDGDEAAFHEELRSYLAEPLQPRSSPPLDPIAYWRIRATTHPILSRCAKKFLTTPASSVDSERAFSTAGQINDDKRSSLSPKKLEILLFLKKNLGLKL